MNATNIVWETFTAQHLKRGCVTISIELSRIVEGQTQTPDGTASRREVVNSLGSFVLTNHNGPQLRTTFSALVLKWQPPCGSLPNPHSTSNSRNAMATAAAEAARSLLFQPITLGSLSLSLTRSHLGAGDGSLARHRRWLCYVRKSRLVIAVFAAEGNREALVVEVLPRAVRDIPSGPLLRIGHDRFIPGLRKNWLMWFARGERGRQTNY
jgi:hypothetical protein